MANSPIEVQDGPVIDELNRQMARLRDLTPANRAIANLMLSRTEANFAAQSGPLGPWPKLKDKGRNDGMILQDSGRLAGSVTPFFDSQVSGIGTNVAYAAIQHQGGDIVRAAYSMQIRHRTNAAGELLRTKYFNGKGLVFAKDSHKRVRTTWAEVAEYTIHIPARPYMPATEAGLQAGVSEEILSLLGAFITGGMPS